LTACQKNRILSFSWIPACAGMTVCELMSITYNTRAGGYPGAKMTFYKFINIEDRVLRAGILYLPLATQQISLIFGGISPHRNIILG